MASSSMMSDWSHLPEELLHLISKNVEDCFDVVHARSVCHSWRSTFPFPCCLLSSSYSLPAFADFPLESKDLCTLKKVPLFLFRYPPPPSVDASLPSIFLVGGIGRDKSEDHIVLLPSPLQCSVKVEIPRLDTAGIKAKLNMLKCQILPLGHHYRMIGWDPEDWTRLRVAFLPLDKEGVGGGEFVVLLSYTRNLLVLRSTEMRWTQVNKFLRTLCTDLVTFRGRFYATLFNDDDIFVIDPYSLKATSLKPSPSLDSQTYLIPSGNDELFLVENFNPFPEDTDLDMFTCRVSRLDEEAGKWVEISDLGDRILFIGHSGNFCCSAKELPNSCGLSGNSILFTNEGKMTFVYKYGVHTGRTEDVLNTWRYSRETQVMILNKFPVLALRLERHAENLALVT